MKKFLVFATLFFLCLVMGFLAHATDVGGLIIEDTTWTKAGSPYVVISNVTVIEDVTLTIKPGVEVKFNQGKALLIDGTLVARGTSSEKIAFTSNGEQKAGYWGYIFFSDSSTDATFDPDGNYTGGCILQYTTIQYGGSGASVIKIDRSSPFIDNSTISQNTGSGIYITNGAPVISNATISGNSAAGLIGYGTPKGGGGIYAASSTITVSNSTISSNSVSASTSDTCAMSVGGGIYATSSTIIVNNSTISENSVFAKSTASDWVSCNSAYSYGGGIYATNSSIVTVSNSIISGNSVTASSISASSNSYSNGGGIYTDSSTVTINNSTISENFNSGEYASGGGVWAYYGTVIIQNSTISGNSASSGGGIDISSSTATVGDSTFSGNSASSGSAIYVGDTDFTMKGNIITENTASAQYGGIVRLDNLNPGSVIGGSSCEDANVIKDNNGDGVWIKGNPAFNHNDVYYTDGFYSLVCGNAAGAPNIDATNNYWGTDKESVVKVVIWDGLDDPALGLVNYNPFLIEPCHDGVGAINGHVTDLAGKPLPATVIAINIETKEKDWDKTDANGYYEILELPPGIYLLIAIAKGYKPGIAKVEVKAGETTTKDFKLKPKPAGDDEDEFADLYANYPNPFNPDTRIPYSLSKDADVTIRIFNSAGQLVRTLNLGRQAAGIYIDKDKAAYWDGKDDLGQQVASGVYYYTLRAGDFSATRKMVILK